MLLKKSYANQEQLQTQITALTVNTTIQKICFGNAILVFKNFNFKQRYQKISENFNFQQRYQKISENFYRYIGNIGIGICYDKILSVISEADVLEVSVSITIKFCQQHQKRMY
eukprot:TRINITY_DN97827_c0_g1_i1.p1 TRINITY_DN97827_c0_g1~~TRINITY_DN97827_c0_g1_i1.p1  ORF type:complete len:113 (+),score=1.58 TRINITY_DN97827_c0_g1_i1:243-581(+)